MKRVAVIRAFVSGAEGLALFRALPESVKSFSTGQSEIQTSFRFPEEETAAMTTFVEMARQRGLKIDHWAQLERVDWTESDDRFYSLSATEAEDTSLALQSSIERVTCRSCHHARERFLPGSRPRLYLYDEPEGGMFTPKPPGRKPPDSPDTSVIVLNGRFADELLAAGFLAVADLVEAEMAHGSGRYFVLAPRADLGMGVGANPCPQCGYSTQGHGLLPVFRRPARPVDVGFTAQFISLTILCSSRLRRHLAGRPNLFLSPTGLYPDDVDSLRRPTFPPDPMCKI
jgi:hypothetical protein